MYVCIYIYIYIKYLSFLRVQPKDVESRKPGGKTASLLIVFATSVSESSLVHFSLQKTE